MTYILEDMLPDQLISTRSLLDLRLQQIARLRPLQLLPLLVKRRWRLQRCVCEKKYSCLSCRTLLPRSDANNFKRDVALTRRGENFE